MDRLTDLQLKQIREICPNGINLNVPLSDVSQWRIGGKADVLIIPRTIDELVNLRRWFYLNNIYHIVIGATSNILFSDEGLRVPCIKIGSFLADIVINDQYVSALAGVWVPKFARTLMKSGLSGGEHVCGIPGTLGGLVCMNGGSQRKGIGRNVISVESVDSKGDIFERTSDECNFLYRSSIYQGNTEIITKINFCFEKAQRTDIRKEMLGILKERKYKFPKNLPNCGSVFKSNPAMYEQFGSPGEVIERIGFKGYNMGSVFVSELHANFIVHRGKGKSLDVLKMIKIIKDNVFSETGHSMESEVLYVGPDGMMISADEAVF
jgi:UDP-N-acetylmuramate dehydrogenase